MIIGYARVSTRGQARDGNSLEYQEEQLRSAGAEKIYYDRKRDWNKMVDRAMATDYSWRTSAMKYQELYDWLIGY